MLGTVPIIALLLLFGNTGFRQAGHYRFSLDFLPILLAVVAPWAWKGRRTPVAFGMLAWSIFYFRRVAWLAAVRFGWMGP